MSLHTERRVVTHAGRRFVVSAPTVETVLTALRVYAAEIVILRREYLKDALTPDVWLDVAAKMLLAKGRASAEVLETCCALWEGGPGQLEEIAQSDPALRENLARAVLDLCNPEAIVNRLSWAVIDAALSGAKEQAEDDGEDGPSAIDVLVVSVALALHQPPAAVMGWPYEMVCDLFETIIPACTSYEKAGGDDKAKLAEYGVH